MSWHRGACSCAAKLLFQNKMAESGPSPVEGCCAVFRTTSRIHVGQDWLAHTQTMPGTSLVLKEWIFGLHRTDCSLALFSFLCRHNVRCSAGLQERRGLGQIFYSLGGKNVVKHRMEIYACSYQIIRYHNQFN